MDGEKKPGELVIPPPDPAWTAEQAAVHTLSYRAGHEAGRKLGVRAGQRAERAKIAADAGGKNPAARALGSITSERKAASSKANGAKSHGRPTTKGQGKGQSTKGRSGSSRAMAKSGK